MSGMAAAHWHRRAPSLFHAQLGLRHLPSRFGVQSTAVDHRLLSRSDFQLLPRGFSSRGRKAAAKGERRRKIAEAAKRRLQEDPASRRRTEPTPAELAREAQAELQAKRKLFERPPPGTSNSFADRLIRRFNLVQSDDPPTDPDSPESQRKAPAGQRRSLSDESPNLAQRLTSSLLRASDRALDRVEERQVGLMNELHGAEAVRRRRFLPATSSKDFESSLGLSAADTSVALPSTDCKALSNPSRIVNILDHALGSGDMEAVLVTYSWREGTTDWCKEWGEKFRARYHEHPTVDAFHLVFRSTVIELILRNYQLKQALRNEPEELHNRILLSKSNGEREMARLGLSGHNYAYVFLLDTDGRIRWMSSGQPGDRDVRLLFRATDQLIVEHRQKELRRAKHTGATADLPEYTEETYLKSRIPTFRKKAKPRMKARRTGGIRQ